jgi:hypothetical protein
MVILESLKNIRDAKVEDAGSKATDHTDVTELHTLQ